MRAIVSVGTQESETPHSCSHDVFLRGTSFSSKLKDKAVNFKTEYFTLQVPVKLLLNPSTLTIAYRKRYGLFLEECDREVGLDERDLGTQLGTPFGAIQGNVRILHIQQEVVGRTRRRWILS